MMTTSKPRILIALALMVTGLAALFPLLAAMNSADAQDSPEPTSAFQISQQDLQATAQAEQGGGTIEFPAPGEPLRPGPGMQQPPPNEGPAPASPAPSSAQPVWVQWLMNLSARLWLLLRSLFAS